jgi:ribosomal protein L1
MKKSKRYIEQKEKIEDRSYSVAESIDLVKVVSSANFDESLDSATE